MEGYSVIIASFPQWKSFDFHPNEDWKPIVGEAIDKTVEGQYHIFLIERPLTEKWHECVSWDPQKITWESELILHTIGLGSNPNMAIAFKEYSL